jgi:hypothetical protein
MQMLSLSLTNKAVNHESIWGNGCIDPSNLDLNTNWRSAPTALPPAKGSSVPNGEEAG